MTERIDVIDYLPPETASTAEAEETIFLTNPGEFLAEEVVALLKADPKWKAVFGDSIDAYKRMDYSLRQLPALRVYNEGVQKPDESWFVNGVLTMDLILPAAIRRTELQKLPSTLTMALLQQFRRTTFFNKVSDRVPGLNELGRSFSTDLSLAFEMGETLVPLTQMDVNFKIDLRVWDEYAESDNRTKDRPFERTLGDLKKIITTIEGLRNEEDIEVELSVETDTTEGS